MWEFDQYSFELTASVLWRINPCLRAKYADEAHLIDWMKSTTQVEKKEPGYWGTGGFIISVCKRHGGEGLYACASVNPFCVSEMLKTIEKALGVAA